MQKLALQAEHGGFEPGAFFTKAGSFGGAYECLDKLGLRPARALSMEVPHSAIIAFTENQVHPLILH